MGFDGKMLIHPAQIQSSNNHFQPSPDQVAEAEAIIAVFSKPEAEGLNATSINGKMVERLHYQQALALMARVEMIKSRTDA
jgi:citrate lyase subunit beta / citryl-CoA lyase